MSSKISTFSLSMPLAVVVILLFANASAPSAPTEFAKSVNEVLELENIEWQTTGPDSWSFLRNQFAKSDGDMLALAQYADDNKLSATFSGPATISFWWSAEVRDSDEEPEFTINGATMLKREEDSDPAWEQVHVNLPDGDHELAFVIEEGEFFLDGFEILPEQVLPIANALGDSSGIWVSEGESWDIEEGAGPSGEDVLVSHFPATGSGNEREAVLVRLSPHHEIESLRYWCRQVGNGILRIPDDGTLTTLTDWQRKTALLPRDRAISFSHRSDREQASTASISDLSFYETVLSDTLDGGEAGRDEFVLWTEAPGTFFRTEGHDPAGNGALGFTGQKGHNSATISRNYEGPGLLTFSWNIWADEGETISVNANENLLLQTTSRGFYGFSHEAFELDSGSQQLVWEMRYKSNPWNPIYLDDVHFSTPADSSIAGALGLPENSNVFTSGNAALSAQADVTHSPGDAIAIAANPDLSGERRTISLRIEGPAIITAWSKTTLPLEASLATFVAGERVTQLDGTSDWTMSMITVPEGDQIVRWELIANDAPVEANHTAWLDDIHIDKEAPASLSEAIEFAVTRSRGSVHSINSAGAALDGEDAIVVFGGKKSTDDNWIELKAQGPGVLQFAARGEEGSGAGRAGWVSLNGAHIFPGDISESWTVQQVFVPEGTNTLRLGAVRRSEFWLDQVRFVRAQEVSVSEALDAPGPGIRFGTVSNWTPLTNLAISADAEDSLVLNAFPFANRTAQLSANIDGPARLSFYHQNHVGLFKDARSLNIAPADQDLWTQQHLFLPEGIHTLKWQTSGNRIQAGLDKFELKPFAKNPFAEALDTSVDQKWIAHGRSEWEIVTGAESWDGSDALQANTPVGEAGVNAALRTMVSGPAMVRFRANIAGPDFQDDWALAVTLRRTDSENGFLQYHRVVRTNGWQEIAIPVRYGDWEWALTSESGYGVTSITVDTFSVSEPQVPLPEGTGAPGLQWRTGGDAPWFGQPSPDSITGVEAVSGILNRGEISWLETTVKGPLRIQFQTDIISGNRNDRLRFSIDGTAQNINARTMPIEEGEHVLRWEYTLSPGEEPGSAVTLYDFRILDDYDTWMIALNLPQALAGKEQDPDADGLNNVIEFWLGLDPLIAQKDAFKLEPTPHGMRVVFLAQPWLADEVQLQASSDLFEWQSIPTRQFYFADQPSTLSHFGATVPQNKQRFFRISAPDNQAE